MSCDRALILAAGRGARAAPLTASTPKCLLPLAGRRLLDWQLGALEQAGITKIGIVTGYRANRLLTYRFRSFHNRRWNKSSVVSSLLVSSSWLEEAPSLIAYGDIVYHPDWISVLRSSRSDIVIVYDTLWRNLWEERFEHPEADAESFCEQEGIVREIGQKVTCIDEVRGQYIGLMKTTPSGWRQMRACLSGLPEPEIARLDVTALLARLVYSGVQVAGVPIAGKWCEVDTVDDLLLYERRVRSSPGWTHDWR